MVGTKKGHSKRYDNEMVRLIMLGMTEDEADAHIRSKYAAWGAKGGKAKVPKGFATMNKSRLRIVSSRGGTTSAINKIKNKRDE